VLSAQRLEAAVDFSAHERRVLEQPPHFCPDEPVSADRVALADAPADVPVVVGTGR
jgi:hypothetical protein